MKKYIILFTGILFFFTAFSATVPQQHDPIKGLKIHENSIEEPLKVASAKKSSFIKKWQEKVIEKKLKKYFSKFEDRKSNTETLSTLSLIFGAIAAVTIFTSIGIVGLILGPAALVLGIIAISRDDASKSAKTKALLGVIFGGVVVAIVLLALAFIAAWGAW